MTRSNKNSKNEVLYLNTEDYINKIEKEEEYYRMFKHRYGYDPREENA